MSVRQTYGRHARLYDAIATLPGLGRWRSAAADALGLTGGDTVVEMGCGTGANLPYLRDRVGPAGQVVGVDLTRPLLERAADRVATAGWRNVHLVHGDAMHPPLEEADAVLGTFLVGLLDDPGTAIDAWCALLGGNGRIALMEATRSSRFAPLTGLFDLWVCLTATGGGAGASAVLTRRVETAYTALVRRTTDRLEERYGLGLVTLVAGSVVEDRPR